MTQLNFGVVTWDENVENKPQNRKKDVFMRLKPGSNRLRLVTQPYQYWYHKIKLPGMTGFGDKVLCSKHHGFCPACEAEQLPGQEDAQHRSNVKPKRRWYVGIIDRKTNTYKILDMSMVVYQSIQGYSRDEDWGDPSQYDIDIVVNKDGGATNYYNVIPKPKKPLSDEDVAIKQDIDLDSLKRKCNPPPAEVVAKRIAEIKEKIAVNNPEPEVPEVEAETPGVSEDEGEEMTFPKVG